MALPSSAQTKDAGTIGRSQVRDRLAHESETVRTLGRGCARLSFPAACLDSKEVLERLAASSGPIALVSVDGTELLQPPPLPRQFIAPLLAEARHDGDAGLSLGEHALGPIQRDGAKTARA